MLDIEFEIKRSDIIDLYSQDYLSSCYCDVSFDELNIQDLQNSGEIDPNATIVTEVISKDKRAIKTRIKEIPFIDVLGKSVPQRLFLPDDVIQIQISSPINLHSCHCILIRPFELPLSTKEPYIHWSQLGNTSQI